jgi:hypothetical protein
MKLDEIVSHYIGHCRDHARAEMHFFEIHFRNSKRRDFTTHSTRRRSASLKVFVPR